MALEHSANAQTPARVHLHVYAGVDIRGGHVLMGVPLARPVSKSSLELPGCAPPHVKFTIIRRPSPATILNGVSTGMYYVAGAKKSNLMLEASMYPFLDRVVKSLVSEHNAETSVVCPVHACTCTKTINCTLCGHIRTTHSSMPSQSYLGSGQRFSGPASTVC